MRGLAEKVRDFLYELYDFGERIFCAFRFLGSRSRDTFHFGTLRSAQNVKNCFYYVKLAFRTTLAEHAWTLYIFCQQLFK